MTQTCDALVLGADEHTGLETARALDREGVRVLGGGLHQRGFGMRSRALTARFVYPNPEHDLDGFLRCVRDAALHHGVRAILPSLDSAVLALHKGRSAFDGVAALGIAPAEALDVVLDKARFERLARSVEVEMPRTIVVASPDDVPPDFPVPAVVKQRESGHLGPRKVIYCGTRDEVLAGVRVYVERRCAPIVQELIYGHGAQIVGVCRGGELLQVFQYRRLHEYSCRGGLGSLSASEALDPALLDRASRLLRALRWDGIVGVEFKVPVNGVGPPRVMEINARFVGFMGLALRAGINFPYLQYAYTLGDVTNGAPIPYRVGVRYQRWLLDTLSLIEVLFDRPEVTGVPLPRRAEALLDYVRALSPFIASDKFHFTDPLPPALLVLRGLPVIARRLVNTLRRRLRGHR
jgi:predicted ATP-grasp superfamily ATP-dependent carboligase